MFNVRRVSFILCLIMFAKVDASKVTLKNLADREIYASFYTDTGKRIGDVIRILPLVQVVIDKPHTAWLSSVAYVIRGSFNPETLLDSYESVPQKERAVFEATVNDKVKKVSLQLLGSDVGATIDEKSDTITLTNVTDNDCFVALYYDDGHEAYRWGNVQKVEANSVVTLFRPDRKCRFKKLGQCIEFFDRNVYVARREDELLSLIKNAQVPQVNVGDLKGSEFYIYINEQGDIAATNAAHWKLLSSQKTVVSLVKPDIDAIKNKLESLDYPGKGTAAAVRRGANISAQEQQFRALRMDKFVRPACVSLLQKQYNITLPSSVKLPTIAFCVSGGGCRAMFVEAGFVAAAEEEGLLPLITYIATLSGSTWFLAGWLASGLSARTYYHHILGQLTNGLSGKIDMQYVVDAALRVKALGFDPSVITLYGAMLGDKLLRQYAPRHNPLYVMYGARDVRVDKAEVPFPLYTAVTPRQFSDLVVSNSPLNYYHWVTFDPYEISIPALQMAIPAYAFGRTFSQGVASTSIPPLDMGYMMGIWGSAMSLNVRDAASVVVGSASPEVAQDINDMLSKSKILQWLVQQRTSPAKVPNFTGDGMMTLVDAGMSLILPVPPLVQSSRPVDIIIALDAGAALKYAPGPRGINQYVQANNIPFPKFDLATVGSRAYTIAWDHGQPTAPAVLYVPMIAHAGYHNGWDPEGVLFSNTFNFTYTRAQAELLSGLGAYMFRQIKPILIDLLREWIQRENPAIVSVAEQQEQPKDVEIGKGDIERVLDGEQVSVVAVPA